MDWDQGWGLVMCSQIPGERAGRSCMETSSHQVYTHTTALWTREEGLMGHADKSPALIQRILKSTTFPPASTVA